MTEGKEVSLTPANIHVITDYFVDKINDYLIVDPPTSGRLVAINNEHQAKVAPSVTIFSVEDLEKQRIRVSWINLTDLGNLIGNTLGGNFRIFLHLRFYVKIYFGHFEAPKTANLTIWAAMNVEFLETFDIFKCEIFTNMKI